MRVRFPIRLAAPALWVAATVLLPALHQTFHGRDHDHVGGGIRFHRHESPPEHRHGDGPWHSHEAPADSDESDPRHGEGSLAHFSYALGEDAPPPVAEISTPLPTAAEAQFPDDPEASPGFFRPASERGPPASSRSLI